MSNLTHDPLIQKWINKLELQDIPIEVIHPKRELSKLGLFGVELSVNSKVFLIEVSKQLPLYSALHKLGYIWIAKNKNKVKELKERFTTLSQSDLYLESVIYDTIIEDQFRKMDKGYQEARGLRSFTHSGTYYDQSFIGFRNNDLFGVLTLYIQDYLNFLYLMPEKYKKTLYRTVINRFTQTRQLILEKTQKEGLNLTIIDFSKLHDLLETLSLKPDYNYIQEYFNQLTKLLVKVRPQLIWN